MKRNILLLWAIGLLQGMVFYAPVATLYRQAAGVGIFQITVIEGISLALSIGLEIPWGWAADRIGYRKTMFVCCSLFFVSKLLFWQARCFIGFLLERILLGVVASGLSGVDSNLLFLSCKTENTHRVFSIYEALQQAGLLLAAGIYGLWIGSDYRLAAFLTAISYGIAALLSFFLRDVSEPGKSPAGFRASLQVLSEQLKNPGLLCFLLAVALVNEVHQTITVFLNQLKYTQVGMTDRGISLAFISLSLAGLTGCFSARMGEKIGKKKMGSLLILCSMLCCLILTAAQNAFTTVLGLIGLRIAFSLLQPLQLEHQNRCVQAENRALALSINALLMNSIAVLVSLILGWAADTAIAPAMMLGAGLCAISLLLYRKSQ